MGRGIREGFILRDGTEVSLFEAKQRASAEPRGPARVLAIYPDPAGLERYRVRLERRTGTAWQIDSGSIRYRKWWRATLVDASGKLRGVFFRTSHGRWERE